MQHNSARLKAAWICLLIVGIGILILGVVAAVAPGTGDEQLMRADGMAATGMGLFGVLITLVPFRRGERWAWYAQWYYPAFWIAHLAGGLPPGNDHVHQVVFILLSLAGLLLPVRVFFPRVTTTA